MPTPTYSHFISLPIISVLAKNYVQYLQLELLEAQPGLLDFQVPPRKLHLTLARFDATHLGLEELKQLLVAAVGTFKERRGARGVPRYIDDAAPDGFFLDEIMQFDDDVVVIKAEDPTHYLDDFRETVGSLFENRNIIADFPRVFRPHVTIYRARHQHLPVTALDIQAVNARLSEEAAHNQLGYVFYSPNEVEICLAGPLPDGAVRQQARCTLVPRPGLL